MAKDTSKTGRARALAVRKSGPPLSDTLLVMLRRPTFAWGLAVMFATSLAASSLIWWALLQPMVAPGTIAPATVTARTDFTLEDAVATAEAQRRAAQRTPNVYVAQDALLSSVAAEIKSLPRTVAGAETPSDLDDQIRDRFALTEERLASVRAGLAESGEPSGLWIAASEKLDRDLRRRPLLDAQTAQRESQGESRRVELRLESGIEYVQADRVIDVTNEERLLEEMTILAQRAGFNGPARESIVHRLTKEMGATFRLDSALTESRRQEQASEVGAVVIDVPAGTVLLEAGTPVTQQQLDRARMEREAFSAALSPLQRWVPRMGVLLTVLLLVSAGSGYVALFCPRIRRNPDRMIGLSVLCLGALAVAVIASAMEPGVRALSALAPVLFVTAITDIAYDRRTAAAVGGLQAVLTALALEQTAAELGAALAAVAVVVATHFDVRDRRTLIRGGMATALAAGVAVLAAMSSRFSITPETMRHALTSAGLAAFAGLLVSGITLFILPTIERLFDITTGMTLIELRDPKHPLLRELQQRAPGTYNHSLNVASIAEQAALSIGADSLLTYVGALYHDIGKMNKPEYFVENQAGGPNKHDKLSPTMSLLVIVGHVKDGIEMAREFALPRVLHHFIEAHHGTTLVSFFFDRAKKEAASDEETPELTPDELNYRYPGPKPQTKEVAILMLADAVESATRALPEPTPSRIESLVAEMAEHRLGDGQFDECALTFSELTKIRESLSKSITAIYHGRISYPSLNASDAQAGA